MNSPVNILAIVGSYRKGGIIERAVDEILAAARKEGAVTRKISLLDKHLEFCTNCRSCTQVAGKNYGVCILDDDMAGLLQEIERADALVLASPMNAGTVTAIMKRFIERLLPTGLGVLLRQKPVAPENQNEHFSWPLPLHRAFLQD